MNKLTKSILALGLAVSMSVPVFATPVEPTSIAQSKPSYEKAWSLLRKEYYKNNTATKQAYTTLVNQCDKYGNILILDAQYYGKLNASAPLRFINSDKAYTPTYKATRPYYYENINTKIDVTKPLQQVDILVKPTKVVNTVTGKVTLPQGKDTTNMWIQVTGGGHGKLQDAVLKVQKDGSFKVENLMDGDYEFKLVVGELATTPSLSDFNYKEVYKPVKVTIKGNTIVELNLETLDRAISDEPVYFGNIDHSYVEGYARHTNTTQPVPLLVNIANQIRKDTEGKSDTEVIDAILKSMNDPKVFKHGTIRNHPVRDIVIDGKINYESCADFANVFSSIARELGYPIIFVGMTELTGIEEYQAGNKSVEIGGHTVVEIYSKDLGKWILVDTTTGFVYEDYDYTNPLVKGSSYTATGNDLIGDFVVHTKSADCNSGNPHNHVFDNLDMKLLEGLKFQMPTKTFYYKGN